MAECGTLPPAEQNKRIDVYREFSVQRVPCGVAQSPLVFQVILEHASLPPGEFKIFCVRMDRGEAVWDDVIYTASAHWPAVEQGSLDSRGILQG